MASFSSTALLFLLFRATIFTLVAGDTFQVDFHHRFSDKVRQWAESQGLPASWHPKKAPKGSVEYFKELIRHDIALFRRHDRLLAATDVYSFAASNETINLPSLGFLHYASVTVGTPNQTFLVALTTGTDFFWLPCNCKMCAPLTSPSYGDLEFSTYSTNASSTSKTVSCGSSQCSLLNNQGGTCTGMSSNCSYAINYSYVNTSSSGLLIEDVLYLAKGSTAVDIIQTPIVFGCGEFQTGAFLDNVAPNGVMGLGIANVSVPTMLARKGLITDSFSMCFSIDDSGRLNFGDKGSSDQSETPLTIDKNLPHYNISIEGMVIGNITTKTSFTALVDSGAPFTILADQIYKELTNIFTAQVTETQIFDPNIPFEYCYQLSSGQTEVSFPPVNLTAKGGSQFPVLNPIVILISEKNKRPFAYCLAVQPSNNKNIIGNNFLMGLRVVFNREKKVLGWKPFDCYSTESSTISPIDKNASAPSPATKAPPPINPETTQLPRTKSSAPDLSHCTMLNTTIRLLLVVFIIFNSVS